MSEQTLIPKPNSETLKQQQQEPITLSDETLKTLKPLSRPVNSLKAQLKNIKSNARRCYLQTLKKKKPSQRKEKFKKKSQRKEPTEPRIRKGRKEMLYLFNNIKPICFSPKIIPKKFEHVLKKLDLFEFTRVEFDSVFKVSMLVDFISNYSRKEKNSFIPRRINVSKEHLARALRLPCNKSESSSIEVYTDEEIAFIRDFVFDWLLVGRYDDEESVMPREIVEWTRCIREGHPEKLDAAQLIWYQVEKELAQSENLVECYYASHLVCLIKSQRPEFFEEEKDESEEKEEARRLRNELFFMSAQVLWLENALLDNPTKFAEYRKLYPVQEEQPDKNEHGVSAEIEENQKSLDGNDADEAKVKHFDRQYRAKKKRLLDDNEARRSP